MGDLIERKICLMEIQQNGIIRCSDGFIRARLLNNEEYNEIKEIKKGVKDMRRVEDYFDELMETDPEFRRAVEIGKIQHEIGDELITHITDIVCDSLKGLIHDVVLDAVYKAMRTMEDKIKCEEEA